MLVAVIPLPLHDIHSSTFIDYITELQGLPTFSSSVNVAKTAFISVLAMMGFRVFDGIFSLWLLQMKRPKLPEERPSLLL